MKGLLFMMTVLFMSCSCLLSQIPPQYLYCDENCQSILPDYRTEINGKKLIIRDNCGIESVNQTPAPGTVVSLNSPITVTIRAIDNSKNFKQVKFTVVALDTIPPTIDSTQFLTDTELNRIERLYNEAELAIYNKMQLFDETFPYERFGLIRDDHDSTYFKQTMITWSPKGYAVLGDQGYGHRYWTWESPGDTITRPDGSYLVVKNYY